MCGFIARLVEHRAGIAEVMGSNPVEALIFSGFFFPIAQTGKFTVMIILQFHLHRSSKYELFHIYTSHHFPPHGRYELNKLTSLPMCGFIVQLAEHRTGIAEITGSNPVEALIFFRLLLSNCLSWKIYCDDHSSYHITVLCTTYIMHVQCSHLTISMHTYRYRYMYFRCSQNIFGSNCEILGKLNSSKLDYRFSTGKYTCTVGCKENHCNFNLVL